MTPDRVRQLTAGLIALPIFVATVLFFQYLRTRGDTGGDEVAIARSNLQLREAFASGLKAYEENRLEDAVSMLSPQALALVDMGLNNSCPLLISVFAQTKSWKLLEKVSDRCISTGKDPEISYEGFAYAMMEQGKIAPAIERLKGGLKEHDYPRIRFALARLCLMIERDQEAANHLLNGIEQAEVWSMWASYGLNTPRLTRNRGFLISLLNIIRQKPRRLKSIEDLIMRRLSEQKPSDNNAAIL